MILGMIELSWKQVWARRLERHYLTEREAAANIAEVVSGVCGIQAQVMPAAEVGVGIRVDGVGKADVQAALWERRELVKTFGLRGTIHLFPSVELPLWNAALRKRSSLDANRFQNLYLTPEQLEILVGAIGDALDGDKLLLQDLGDRVVEQVGSWAAKVASPAWGGTWPLWRKALGEAALEGKLCYGPPVGNKVTFVRPDQWLEKYAAGWVEIEPEAALAEVFRRYLRAYGPATSRDFAQWFSIPPKAGKEAAAGLGDELVEVDVEGYKCVMLAEDVGADWARYEGMAVELPVRLLPHFDCYVIGCHPRKELLPGYWAERVPPRSTPSQFQTVLVDGMVGGLWDRQVSKGGNVEISVEAFAGLSKAQKRSLEGEAERIGRILGGVGRLTLCPVAVKPHL